MAPAGWRRYRGGMSATLDPAAPPERGFNRFVAALSLRGVLLAMVLASLAAVLLNPIFVTPFPVLLGRMLVIALLLLLVFTAAGFWSVGWLPRWLVQVLAVVLAAPLATYLVYLPAVQGIARATVRARREDPRMARWLEVIAMQGEDEEWVRWARERGTASALRGLRQ